LLFWLSSCSTKASSKPSCMECMGCFGSWQECETDYRPNPAHPISWEEYVDSVISQNPISTNRCHLTE
jgi:hypothetical protein